MSFDNGAELAFTDPRRLARVRLVRNPEAEPPVSELGPDALLELPALPSFEAALAGRSSTIKALLLDQGFLAGIGNWVADEVLYQARIHPETAAHALDRPAIAALHTAIRAVLEHAVSVGADSAKFPPNWLFHARWGKGKGPAKTADGKAITFVTVGGRTSAVVPSVQGAPKSKPAEHVAAVLAARTAAARATAGATLAAAAAGGAAGGAGASSAGGAMAAAATAKAKPKTTARKQKADAMSPADATSSSASSSAGAAAAAPAAAAFESGSSDGDGHAVVPVGKAKPRQRRAKAPAAAAAADAEGSLAPESAASASPAATAAEPPSLTGFKRPRSLANDARGSRGAAAAASKTVAAADTAATAVPKTLPPVGKGKAGSASSAGDVGTGTAQRGPAAKRARAAAKAK